VLCTLLFLHSKSYAQISVNTALTPAQVINTFVGSGVTVFNISYSGQPNSLGTFSGTSNLGFNNGIIFSTGGAGQVSNGAGYFMSDAGMTPTPDPNLAGIATAGVNDAAIIEFDFYAKSDTVSFEYVFASEEYSDWVNSGFNDVFGFFVSGPGITGTMNVALIPGTATPVAINNVNNGNSPVGVVPTGPCTNCAYYKDNTNGTTVCFDGMTQVLKAVIPVQICQTYHIKLAVGNVGDGAYDSGVFLKANSLNASYVPVYQSGSSYFNPTTLTAGMCQGDTITLTSGAAFNYLWTFGQTTQSIQVWNPGSYSVFVLNPNNGCFLFSQSFNVLQSNIVASVSPAGLVTLCPGDSVTLSASPPNAASYSWSNGATTQSIVVSTSTSLTCTVTDTLGCSDISNMVTVNAGTATASITPSGPTTICPGSNVTLTANIGSIYLWSNGATTQSINVSSAGTYTVTVTQAAGCSATSPPINVSIGLPTATITPSGSTTLCIGNSVTLSANAGANYQWSNGATTQNISVSNTGTFTVTVTDANGCTATSSPVAVNVVTALANISVTGAVPICPGNSVTLGANAGLAWVWSTGATTQNISVAAAGNYTVTVTNFNSCVATSSPTSITTSTPLASITPLGSTVLCPGSTVTLQANVGNSYLWSNGSTQQSITVSNSGNFTVTVTNADNCQAISAPIAVSVNTPVATITPSGPTSFCNGGSVTLSANAGSAYNWSNGATTQNINVNSNGSFVVTVTDINGCTAVSSNVSVSVNSALASISISGNTLLCPGDNVVLSANPSASYLWTNGATTQNISVNSAGVYNVTITTTDGCTASAVAVPVVVSNPTASITPLSSTTICPGDNVTLQANSGITYLWSNGATTQSINVSSAGNFTVIVTNVDNCSATSLPQSVVVSNPIASITPLGPTTFCDGQSVQLNANSGTSYTWSNGSTLQSINVTNAGTYTVTVTNADGCTAVSSNVNIIVNTAVANITLTGNSVLCPGDVSTLSANAGSAYLWSTGASTQNIQVNNSGNYSVTVTNMNGCTAIASPVQITVSNPSAIITPLSSTTICPGFAVVLQANLGTSYLWSNGSTTQSISVNNNGTFTVSVTNADGCVETSAPVSVQVSIPVANITPAGPTTFCDGDNVVLTANAGVGYHWSNGLTTQSITVSQAGTYTVVVTDANGCSETSTPTLINVLYATAAISAGGPTDFCDGGSVALSANNGLAYLWSNGLTTQTINTSSQSNYTVIVTNLNGCTAISSPIPVIVHPYPIVDFASDTSLICETLKVKFTNKSQTEPNSFYAWTFGDGGISNLIHPSHIYALPGTYTVSLTVISPFGCKSSDSSDVTVVYYPPPVADFRIDPKEAPVFNSKITFKNLSQNMASAIWSFGDGTTSDEMDVVHYYDEPGKYIVTLTIYSPAGCIDRKSEEVYIFPFFIPNAFTPNNDGRNDVFFDGVPPMDIQAYEMIIFNRWGEKVYSSNDYRFVWDGSFQNQKDAPSGTYVYLINVVTHNGKEHNFRGSVNLIR